MLEGEIGGSHTQVQVLLAEGTFHPCFRREGGGEAGEGGGEAGGECRWVEFLPPCFYLPKEDGEAG